jgi:hypothetical protein
MRMLLPVINPFNGSLEGYGHVDEPYKSIIEILNSKKAALFNIKVQDFLESGSKVKIWKKTFSQGLSENLKNYQECNVEYDKEQLENEINTNGIMVPDGQYLFHGGFLNLNDGEERSLDRHFATSIIPQEAFFHATLGGRAYDNEKIEILIIRVENSTVKSLILFSDEALLSHEHEVLFAKGLMLTVVGKINTKYKIKVDDCRGNNKNVPIDIIFCNIS